VEHCRIFGAGFSLAGPAVLSTSFPAVPAVVLPDPGGIRVGKKGMKNWASKRIANKQIIECSLPALL